MNAWQNFMRLLNHISKSSWSWNMSMEGLSMDISRANPIGKWLKLKLSFCGNKLYLVFITFIREMSRIEILSLRIFCWMKREQGWNWLISGSLHVSLMKRKWKYSAVLHHIWLLKLCPRLNMLDHQQISGLWEFFCMLYFVADSHSKDQMIKSSTPIYANKICH